MNIQMIGIDHNMASVDIRSKFSFTKKTAGLAMEALKQKSDVSGCVILSTCNRLEIWVSTRKEEVPLYQYLCELKGLDSNEYEEFFKKRRDQKAVEHLFYLTAGLKSQIMGEDQILTQVKDALNLARENFATDGMLEVLFRMAITAGKKIKTEIPFAHGNPSVIHRAIYVLEQQGFTFDQKTCMVIGNGEMGKVAAKAMMDAGAKVMVTVRQYRSGIVDIPFGCERINYTDRFLRIPECDVIVSATASPNFTITKEKLGSLSEKEYENKIFIDLAVPRDIEPDVKSLPGVQMYDMDSFDSDVEWEEQKEQFEAAGKIVKEQMQEFYQWADGREVIPRIQELQQDAVEDLNLRIQKNVRKMMNSPEESEQMISMVDQAMAKVVGKMIFGLRDQLDPDQFLECVSGLEKIYEE
ncbi:MAG: glutamyl-tRNA reductase [Eubacteriales bacterium]|nr:glutamyl-tRNA reductase [Eubacteriales bacterium]